VLIEKFCLLAHVKLAYRALVWLLSSAPFGVTYVAVEWTTCTVRYDSGLVIGLRCMMSKDQILYYFHSGCILSLCFIATLKDVIPNVSTKQTNSMV
jgi:hypothetical protein